MSPFIVHVSATTANVGPGFDCLGLALQLDNELRVQAVGDSLKWSVQGEGAAHLPANASNLSYVAMQKLFGEFGKDAPGGLEVLQTNRIPLSRGLGSSASAIVAGLLAANHLLGHPCPAPRLLCLANELEGHPDNVAAALLGGLTVSYLAGSGEARAIRLTFPEALRVVLAIPEVRISTEAARRAMPTDLPLADAVYSLSRACVLLAAVQTGNWSHLREATSDRIHTPTRKSLIKGYDAVHAAALSASALGVFISGSGPTVAAFCEPDRAQAIGSAMVAAFTAAGVPARSIVTTAAARPATCCEPGGDVRDSSHEGLRDS